MGTLCALTSCLLLIVGAVTAQTDPTHTNGRPLPQWLTGIIAVAGFLFLAFVVLLAKKAWCEKSYSRSSIEAVGENPYDTHLDTIRRKSVESGKENTYDRSLSAIRSKDGPNGYDNLGIDKATAM